MIKKQNDYYLCKFTHEEFTTSSEKEIIIDATFQMFEKHYNEEDFSVKGNLDVEALLVNNKPMKYGDLSSEDRTFIFDYLFDIAHQELKKYLFQ